MGIMGCNTISEVKPNFLIIIVDDLGWRDLGFTGSKVYETPNLDKMAKQGMVFTNGYSNCSVCSPSRASIMTGLHVTNHGITNWIGAPSKNNWNRTYTKLAPPEYVHYLPHENITIAEALRENGYKTFFAGKWHLGGKDAKSLPIHHGFEINKGGYHKGGPYSGGYFSPFNNPYLVDYESEEGMTLSSKLAKETNLFIENQRDSTFMAVLSFYGVHAPIQTSPDKWSKYRDKIDSLGIEDTGFEMERILPIRKNQDNPVYAGLVEQIDDAVGMVVQRLKELNLFENTVIIFTSDNGGVSSGDDYATSNFPIRGGKGYQWEGGIKVPFMVSYPKLKSTIGTISETPVLGMDIYPTILDLANIDKQNFSFLDGQSFDPILNGKTIKNRDLFWHYPHYGNQGGEPNSIVRSENWKLIHYWEDGRNELYNLVEDPSEKENLAPKYEEKTHQFYTKLLDWLNETNAARPISNRLFDVQAEKAFLEKAKEVTMFRLEGKRKQMLKEDWQPNENWWGSKLGNGKKKRMNNRFEK